MSLSTLAGAGRAPAEPRDAVPAGLVGPGSVAWRINGERAVLLGWGGAILLQLAHPLVAAGVAQHSDFSASPAARLQRLQRTLTAMLTLTFGTRAEAEAVGRHIDGIHGHVRGALREDTGDLAAGTAYFARDPALLKWVHCTFADSALRTYALFVRPLGAAERDAYCAETSAVAPLLQIPPGVLPTTHAALREYLAAMLASERIAVGPTARALARALLAPLGPPPLRPLETLLQLPIVALLPPRLRAAYGLRWSPRRARLLAAWAAMHRRCHPWLPAAARRWPQARHAEQRYVAARA
jgi:uncharacterized protein (DUF2236 family)